jgi:hypothetical protein
MIKILEYGKADKTQVFSRVEPKVNVSAIVSEIIDTVRKSTVRYQEA